MKCVPAPLRPCEHGPRSSEPACSQCPTTQGAAISDTRVRGCSQDGRPPLADRDGISTPSPGENRETGTGLCVRLGLETQALTLTSRALGRGLGDRETWWCGLAGSHWEPPTWRASPGAGWRGQGQALGLLEGAVLAGLCRDRGPARSGPVAVRPPLQEPGGPRGGAAPRDQTRPRGQPRGWALTSACLQLAGQHLPDLAHPGCLDFRSGCLCPRADQG